MNNEKKYFLKIPKKSDNNIEKPMHGLHVDRIESINDKKYLIKKTNSTSYPNNEIYITSILEILLGKENSVQSFFTYDNNINFNQVTSEIEKKLKIASIWIEDTQNLIQTRINSSKKPKNLVASLFASLLSGNMDLHPGNILVDKNNKFYVIDPMVRSSENKYGLDTEALLTRISNSYEEFLKNLTKDNIKQKISLLLNEYFKVQSDSFYPILKHYEDNRSELETEGRNVEKYIKAIDEIIQTNEEIIKDNSISNSINLMDAKEIIAEIKIIIDCDKKELEKIGEYFEDKKIFENFGKKGIKPGHMKIVLELLERLSKVDFLSIN
jgi:hypothetical protein